MISNTRKTLSIGLTLFLPFLLTSCSLQDSTALLLSAGGLATEELIIIWLVIPYTVSLLWLFVDYQIHIRNSRMIRSIRRFGIELDQLTYTIGGKENWDEKKAMRLAAEIQNRVFEDLNARLSIKVKNTNDPNNRAAYGSIRGYMFETRYSKVLKQNRAKKQFLIAKCLHPSRHILTYLVTYELIGNYTIAHHLVYLKGKNQTYNLFLFWLFMPKLLLFTLYSKRGNLIKDYFNIIDPSLFDTLDINGFRKTCHESITESTESILKEKGLLTEQIQTIINQSILNQNVSNTQNLNVSGSGHALMGFNQSNTTSN